MDDVERGVQVDPSGQYVAKKTIVTDHRLTRPSFDAATPAFAQHYTLLANGRVTGIPSGGVITNNVPPFAPSEPGGPAYNSTFVSTEGQALYSGSDNPQGYIYDLKVVVSTTNTQPVARMGYTILYPDLNRGAGGHTIYLAYTRNPARC